MAERSKVMEQEAVRDGSAVYVVEPDIATAEDVPPGYKRTEVGVIPEDWSTETIFAVADYSKSRFDDGDWVEAEFLTTSGVRLLQTGNIGVGVFKEKESKKYISTQSFQQLRCKDVFPGDLLICRLADPAGRACIAPNLDPKRMITSVDVTIFRPSPELAEPKFLLGVFCTPRWFSEVADRCGGSTRTRISRSQLAKIPVQLPSIEEQRAIATALSDADALIESLDRLIAKKRAIKQAAMQQLLTGQTRLPGFTGEWEKKRLGDVAEIDPENLGSSTPPTFTFNYISLEQVEQGRLLGWSVERFATSPSRARRVLRSGDILVSTVRPNLQSHYYFDGGLPNPVCSTGFAVVRCNTQSAHAGYVYAHLFGSEVNRQIDRIIAGSNYPAISSGDVKRLKLPFPALEEQTAIATVLSDMDTEIEALERRRDKAREIKQGMMQQLLTGRVRLVAPPTREPVEC